MTRFQIQILPTYNYIYGMKRCKEPWMVRTYDVGTKSTGVISGLLQLCEYTYPYYVYVTSIWLDRLDRSIEGAVSLPYRVSHHRSMLTSYAAIHTKEKNISLFES